MKNIGNGDKECGDQYPKGIGSLNF